MDDASLYLDLMERCLANTIYQDRPFGPWNGLGYDAQRRRIGGEWPSEAHTMIGTVRLHQFRTSIERAIEEQISGDIVETGVWRGGACIMARAVLKAHHVTDRTVWCVDSFEGVPAPDPRFPADRDDRHFEFKELAASLQEVQDNFRKYGLLDDQVRFLKGWFKDTLPNAPIDRLSVLRLDGDMYQSTMDAISSLYQKVEAGGFVIVDDYGSVPGCRRAIEDFRRQHDIAEPIENIDGRGAYWRKSRAR